MPSTKTKTQATRLTPGELALIDKQPETEVSGRSRGIRALVRDGLRYRGYSDQDLGETAEVYKRGER